MNTKAAQAIAQTIIEAYELDYGSSEAIIQETDLIVELEAENSGTTQAWLPITESTDVYDIVRKIKEGMYAFDADEQFDELYSPDFARHNNLTPSRFIAMLLEDEQYFKNAADKIDPNRIRDLIQAA
ncbi:hypothetical protein [Bifidobacterium tibiigranuli]|jgi:hypothetical protein|uniref:hypothetical protein n=1 Tax=Bifidobacterium tibiigranuli TaxID=2172043 RepID=UPI002356835F|nr:hypothetical protein [Bifidobacterium tibiigranuli]MCH3973503.1 hypothetical protein [Bifidobacterium tibiigranuli]MCI1713363.1 hypothetical protein [Bifidobacterium tibiigranuli]MCI2184852.1 hypothetical protein [Bifidobacterium tibiigranuli]MCI2204357.1 hypothetical protein [Bifidobacterium tibiigranuli]